jgi:hypothetical protein
VVLASTHLPAPAQHFAEKSRTAVASAQLAMLSAASTVNSSGVIEEQGVPPSAGHLLYCPWRWALQWDYGLLIMLLFSELSFAIISETKSSAVSDEHTVFLAAGSSLNGQVELRGVIVGE